MRRFRFAVLPALLLAAGCTEVADLLPEQEHLRVFTASSPVISETRTTLEADESAVDWTAGDEIVIFDAEFEGLKYKGTSSGPSTVFSLVGTGAAVEPESGEYWHALYPYDADATCDGTSIHTTLKNEYTLTGSNTFADGMNIAVARSASMSLKFTSVLSWVPVAIKGVKDVDKLVVKGNAGETLAGPLCINAETAAATLEGEGSQEITLNVENFEESESRDARKNLYVPFIPGVYQKGFTVHIHTASGNEYDFVFDKSVTLKAGKKARLFVDLSGNRYARVENTDDLDEVENGEFLLVYAADGAYNVFSFQKTMENLSAEADRISTVGGLSALMAQATQIYQNVLKANYVTATSTDGGATIMLPEEEAEKAVIIANGNHKAAEVKLSATVGGKSYQLRMEKITAELKDNHAALLSAVFNGGDLMDIAATLRGHEISLTFADCIDFLGGEAGLDADQISLAKRAFNRVCVLVEDYTGKSFPVTTETTVAQFYRQYWDNIRDYADQFARDKKWGSAYPFGFYKADDGFTFNMPVPNSIWFQHLEESTSGSIDDFVAYWTAYDNYHNFPFKKLAEKAAEYLTPSNFAKIQDIDFAKIGTVYDKYVNRVNDSLEDVYIYKKID